MSRKLLLLRHAKSSRDSDVLDDFERPLARRGVKGTSSIAGWMRNREMFPDFIITSPAVRAQQTTWRICDLLALPAEAAHPDQRLYLADPATLFEVLAGIPVTVRLPMLVGHNPGLDELLRYLCGDDELPRTTSGKLMSTATIAVIELPEDWNALSVQCGRLIELVRPKELESSG